MVDDTQQRMTDFFDPIDFDSIDMMYDGMYTITTTPAGGNFLLALQ